MLHSDRQPPEGLHLFADHLDAALAIGEDLLALRLAPLADLTAEQSHDVALGTFVAKLQGLEAALLLRLLQARRRAAEMATSDTALRSVLRLVATSTDSLLDLIGHYGRRDAEMFRAGGDLQHELRRRVLIPAEAAAVSPFEAVVVTDDTLIGGVAPLGGLLDMAAAALDLLDNHYDLFGREPEIEATGEAETPDTMAAAILEAIAAVKSEGPKVGETETAEVKPDVDESSATVDTPKDEAAAPVDDTSGPGSLRAALDALQPQA